MIAVSVVGNVFWRFRFVWMWSRYFSINLSEFVNVIYQTAKCIECLYFSCVLLDFVLPIQFLLPFPEISIFLHITKENRCFVFYVLDLLSFIYVAFLSSLSLLLFILYFISNGRMMFLLSVWHFYELMLSKQCKREKKKTLTTEQINNIIVLFIVVWVRCLPHICIW